MKNRGKYIALLIFVAILLLLCGCETEPASERSAPEDVLQSEAAQAPADAAPSPEPEPAPLPEEDVAEPSPMERYAEGEAQEKAGNLGAAAIAFCKAGDYRDAFARGLALWDQVAKRQALGAGGAETTALKRDGTIYTTLHRTDILDLPENIIAVSGELCLLDSGGVFSLSSGREFNEHHYVAVASPCMLAADGTAYEISYSEIRRIGDDEDGWHDLVAITPQYAALRTDGAVLCKYFNGRGRYRDWPPVQAIAGGDMFVAGLTEDGRVLLSDSFPVTPAEGEEDQYIEWEGTDEEGYIIGWEDIVAIEAYDRHLIGLRSDGTVLAIGKNEYGCCDVSQWSGIVEISTGYVHTAGLTADGRVLATGLREFLSDSPKISRGQCETEDWENVGKPNN